MTVPVILLGPGGNVTDMAETIEDVNRQEPRYELLGFLINKPEMRGRMVEGYPVLGTYADAQRLAERYPRALFSTWLGGVGSYLRRPAMVASLGLPPERFVTLVHPSSYVSRRARLGRGVIIFQQCTITNNVALGDHVVVLPHSVISHDDVIGDFTVVTGAVAIAGQVTVGPRYATRGMVASTSPAAAAVGMRVLLDGGNAFDAAVAVAAVEGLTLPAACGLGGDAFAVLYEAKSGRVYGINGSGAAPLADSPDRYRSRGLTALPASGWDTVTVPGAPHAYWTLHQRFGSRPWPEVLAPAIQYAEEGLPVSRRIHRWIVDARTTLERFPASAAVYFPGGEPLSAGARWRRPDYAWSLRHLAEGGADAYYRGPVAAEIVRCSEQAGGLFTEADFARHTTEVYEPIHTTYRGIDVYGTRPPSQGLILLETLNLLEGFDLGGAGFGSADALHLMAEAMKLAFADRLRYAGDPRAVALPLGQLLSKPFASRRRRAIDPRRAAAVGAGALPADLHGDTTSFCVADGAGNAISFIHSLFSGWGSGVVAGRTGITLNNRRRGFHLEEGHPNVLAGGKRPMHTLNSYLLMRDGALFAVGNTPGGDMQPQWNAQVIANLLDFGMDVQRAVEAPRWHIYPGTDPATQSQPVELRLESRFAAAALAELRERGHRVIEQGPWAGGGWCQLITVTPDGVLVGGSDPRAASIALGV